MPVIMTIMSSEVDIMVIFTYSYTYTGSHIKFWDESQIYLWKSNWQLTRDVMDIR
jgi:hypothetical protein